MKNELLSKSELRKKVLVLLREQLPVNEYIEIVQDMGIPIGDFTAEKQNTAQPSIEDILQELKNK
ncbi:MAG: hypothetical protein HYZ54_10985 [Ignavibacteriae bacterium]|nr:hypothetical protein [Ignavibacteriota bacterium]